MRKVEQRAKELKSFIVNKLDIFITTYGAEQLAHHVEQEILRARIEELEAITFTDCLEPYQSGRISKLKAQLREEGEG